MGTHRIPLSNAETDIFLTVPAKLDELSAPTDTTTLNATTTTHGLCPKGTITGIKYLKNDITWDEITLDECASPSDTTNLNASTAAHGLCPKGSNTGSKYLRDDISWTVIDIDGGSP